MALRYYDQGTFWSQLGVDPSTDFHALSSRQVDRVIEEADRYGYRRPKNASGSRARYFYQLMQRRRGSKRNPNTVIPSRFVNARVRRLSNGQIHIEVLSRSR